MAEMRWSNKKDFFSSFSIRKLFCSIMQREELFSESAVLSAIIHDPNLRPTWLLGCNLKFNFQIIENFPTRLSKVVH